MNRPSRALFGPRTARAAAIVLLASAVGGAFAPGLVRAASQSASKGAGALQVARVEAGGTNGALQAARAEAVGTNSLLPAAQSEGAGTSNRTGDAHAGPLARPASWQALLRESGENGQPVVVLFSTPGCAFCELVRRDHLRHLARAQGPRGMRVVELGLTDRAPLGTGESIGTGTVGRTDESAAPNAPAPLTPAALAASLGIRFAPTVAFFGPGGELAERLVGYQSADFYGAYLDERIATARAALTEDKRR